MCNKNINYKKRITAKEIENLSEDTLINASDIDWYNISCIKGLSENFIRKYSYKVDWFHISIYQTFPVYFIFKFYNKIF